MVSFVREKSDKVLALGAVLYMFCAKDMFGSLAVLDDIVRDKGQQGVISGMAEAGFGLIDSYKKLPENKHLTDEEAATEIMKKMDELLPKIKK